MNLRRNGKDAANALRLYLLEIVINTVLYHRHIYPDAIFRKTRAFSTFVHLVVFPPLLAYLRKVMDVCQQGICQGTLRTVEIELWEGNEIIETHELKIGQITALENDFEMEERVKEMLLKLDTKFRALKPLPSPETTTFQIKLHTTYGALRRINDNVKHQDFSWTRSTEAANPDLLYNPVFSDSSLGVDIAVNQKINLILP